jgi:multidrug efflux pump
VNPANGPILILVLTSKTRPVASSTTQQAMPSSSGSRIGEVIVGGSALPAVRVELNLVALFKYGIGLEDVRATLASVNANSPKPALSALYQCQIAQHDGSVSGTTTNAER